MVINVKSMAHSVSTKNLINKKETCYGCVYFVEQRNRCNWFYTNGHGYSKRIPQELLDKGCKHRKGITVKANKLAQYIINKFEGEII